MIGASGQSASTGSRVPIVRGNAESGQRTGKKGQMLEIRDFKTVEPSAAGIDGLTHSALGYGCAVGSGKFAAVDNQSLGDDGIGEVFVEVSRCDHTEATEVMLHKHINVVRSFRLQIRIP